MYKFTILTRTPKGFIKTHITYENKYASYAARRAVLKKSGNIYLLSPKGFICHYVGGVCEFKDERDRLKRVPWIKKQPNITNFTIIEQVL